MKLGTLIDLRMALGTRSDAGGQLVPTVSESYAGALKRAALNERCSARIFDIDEVVRWRKQNPGFKQSDTYPLKPGQVNVRPRQCNPSSPKAATAGKTGESLLMHV